MEDQLTRTPDLQSDNTPLSLLSDAATLYGLLLTYDPILIEKAREIFYTHAVVSSVPTFTGVKEIDGSHPLFGYHRLKYKPLRSFQKNEFLLLEEGKQQDLLKYSIDIREGEIILKNQLLQLLADQHSPYFGFQEISVKQCVNVLKGNTMDYLKNVGLVRIVFILFDSS